MTRASPAGGAAGPRPRPPGSTGRPRPASGGTPPPARARRERLVAVGGAQRRQLGQVGGQPGVARGGRPGDELLRDRAERRERLLRRGLRPHRPARRGPGAAVVLVEDRGLARGDRGVLGEYLPGRGVGDQQPPAGLGDRDLPRRSAGSAPSSGPSRTGRTTAGRPSGSRRAADRRPQRRQRPEQLPLGLQPLRRDRADLRVRRLRSPRRTSWPPHVRRRQVATGPAGPSDRASRSRRGSPRCPWTAGPPPRTSQDGTRNGRRTGRTRRRHDPVRDDAALQAAHPVREHDLRDPAELLEALREQRAASSRPSRLPANRTNRTRDHASTAQNTCSAPMLPQSIASTSPGAQTAGRRPRW